MKMFSKNNWSFNIKSCVIFLTLALKGEVNKHDLQACTMTIMMNDKTRKAKLND
jgi:hypothetical protein